MISGADLREIGNNAMTTDVVCFIDADGKMHNIVGAKRVRHDGIVCLIFNESNPNVELNLDAPSDELIEHINRFYDENGL